jgi:2-keto-4-pentenoate hydratase
MKTGDSIAQAAGMIRAAWRNPLPQLRPELRPRNLVQAYGVQQAVSTRFGAIGGWRICRAQPVASRACAPLPLASIRPAPAHVITAGDVTARLEAELCFRVGSNLPDYDAPYTREQILAAIQTCHPGVTVLNTHFIDADPTDPLTAVADGCGHRYLVYGQAAPDRYAFNLDPVTISVLQGGRQVFSCIATPPDDVVAALQWLANEGSRWAGGLSVGQWVAVDLEVGEIRIRTDQPARVVMGGLGAVDLRFF